MKALTPLSREPIGGKPMEWRPIETIPMEVSVLVYWRDKVVSIIKCAHVRMALHLSESGATHWMPLPPPPVQP